MIPDSMRFERTKSLATASGHAWGDSDDYGFPPDSVHRHTTGLLHDKRPSNVRGEDV